MGLEFYEDNRRYVVAVRIRMKKLGRKHRPFFRICAVDSRAPRDGRVLEELGTYDPMIPETDARAGAFSTSTRSQGIHWGVPVLAATPSLVCSRFRVF